MELGATDVSTCVAFLKYGVKSLPGHIIAFTPNFSNTTAFSFVRVVPYTIHPAWISFMLKADAEKPWPILNKTLVIQMPF